MPECVMCGATDETLMTHSKPVVSLNIGPFHLLLEYVTARTCLECGAAYAHEPYLDPDGDGDA